MSKEQHINEPFTMMLYPVAKIIDCLSTVNSREHNGFFSYRTETTNHRLLRMITDFYRVTFLTPLSVWTLIHGNHTRMFFYYMVTIQVWFLVKKDVRAWFLVFKICTHTGFFCV